MRWFRSSKLTRQNGREGAARLSDRRPPRWAEKETRLNTNTSHHLRSKVSFAVLVLKHDAEQAFRNLKQALVSASALTLPDHQKPFIQMVDC